MAEDISPHTLHPIQDTSFGEVTTFQRVATHFNRLDPPIQSFLAIVASGGCSSLYSGSLLLGVHVLHALGSAPVFFGVVSLSLPFHIILGVPVL